MWQEIHLQMNDNNAPCLPYVNLYDDMNVSISQQLPPLSTRGWRFGPTNRKQRRLMGVLGVHFRLCEGPFVRQHFLYTMLALCLHAVLEYGAAYLIMLQSQFSVNVH